jgi:tRNA A22 N-methylase
MAVRKVVVTGASRLLGSKIIALAEEDLKIIPTHRTVVLQPESVKLDIRVAT